MRKSVDNLLDDRALSGKSKIRKHRSKMKIKIYIIVIIITHPTLIKFSNVAVQSIINFTYVQYRHIFNAIQVLTAAYTNYTNKKFICFSALFLQFPHHGNG